MQTAIGRRWAMIRKDGREVAPMEKTKEEGCGKEQRKRIKEKEEGVGRRVEGLSGWNPGGDA